MTKTPSSSAQRWTRVIIIIIAIAMFLSYMALSPALRFLAKQDRISAHPVTGTGIVEQVIPPHLAENSPMSGTQNWVPAQVWIRIKGRLAISDQVFGFTQLHAGGPAQVVYRVGRSGRLYIDRVEPLPTPQSRPDVHQIQ